MWAVQALDPCGGPNEKPHATKRQDHDKHQSDAPDAAEHFADTRTVQKVGEQRQPDTGGQNTADGWTAAEVSLHNQLP